MGKTRPMSSPPGTFSTLMTSAPMSASSIPHAGPDMMCELDYFESSEGPHF